MFKRLTTTFIIYNKYNFIYEIKYYIYEIKIIKNIFIFNKMVQIGFMFFLFCFLLTIWLNSITHQEEAAYISAKHAKQWAHDKGSDTKLMCLTVLMISNLNDLKAH